MTPQERAKLAAWKAELAAAFNARRCCICGAPARSVCAGTDAVRQSGILLHRARQERNFCLACLLENRSEKAA